MSYAEIHFHLLPAIDDGPVSVEESVALARAAVADGTRTIVATPHVHREHVTDPTEIAGRVRELADRLRRERIAIELRPGGELAHDMVANLSNRQLTAIAQGPPSRPWVLLEAAFDGLDDAFEAAASELRARGFGIVIAHPERALQTPATVAVLEREQAAGSAIQLTAGSLAGRYGERARQDALRLLRSGWLAVIASDAHNEARMPALRLALAALAAAGERDGARLAGAVPLSLLRHGLPVRPPALVS